MSDIIPWREPSEVLEDPMSEMVEEEKCAVCDNEGWYMTDDWHHGEIIGFRKIKCLCKVISDWEDEANNHE